MIINFSFKIYSKIFYRFILVFMLFKTSNIMANLIVANNSNYTNYLNALVPGDTLYLRQGVYDNNLKLNGLNGTPLEPIVIIGEANKTIFIGQSCCNTVSITKCSYIVIKNIQLDGQNLSIDAVKAEGTTGNWAHHITIEYLNIINYGNSQQNVGISTKCSAWNWLIRKNTIIGAGTGMYLGNSNGDAPFVNGIIEYNYIANTVGYNMEIKHQLNQVRNNFTGTSVDGKTIIRKNVFTKDSTSSTGGNARPNLLVGGFPLEGFGSKDYYEIYGNFFYNNPVEALFQGTGNIIMYNNIFVNHYDPSGFRAIYITPQNGVSPQNVKIFHNTVWTLNSSGGIRLYNPNTSYQQHCYANAVFATSPITNFTNSLDNITDSYSNIGKYVISATSNITQLNLYPRIGQLTGSLTLDSLFHLYTQWDKDFNGDLYKWSYRGAYSGCCMNNGWPLQLDTIASQKTTTSIHHLKNEMDCIFLPNPINTTLYLNCDFLLPCQIEIFNTVGEKVFGTQLSSTSNTIDFTNRSKGIYIMSFKTKNGIFVKKILKQ